MGIIWSLLPSIKRNTMCCVDVRTKKPFWERELKVKEPYHRVIVKNISTNDEEFDESVNTTRVLREVHFNQKVIELK